MIFKGARGIVAALITATALVGCSNPFTDHKADSVEEWLEEQQGQYSDLSWERDDSMMDTPVLSVVFTATLKAQDRAEAERFAAAYQEKAGGLDDKHTQFLAHLYWPVDGGTAMVAYDVERGDDAKAWDAADRSLPAGASERNVGTFCTPDSLMDTGVDEPPLTLIAEDPQAVAASGLSGESTDYDLMVRDSACETWFGPGTAEELKDRAAWLTQLQRAQMPPEGVHGRYWDFRGGADALAAAKLVGYDKPIYYTTSTMEPVGFRVSINAGPGFEAVGERLDEVTQLPGLRSISGSAEGLTITLMSSQSCNRIMADPPELPVPVKVQCN